MIHKASVSMINSQQPHRVKATLKKSFLMPFLSFVASQNCTFFKNLAQATMKCLVLLSFLCANWYRIIRLSSIYSRYSAAVVVAAMEQKLKSLQKFCRQTQKISSFTHHNVCVEEKVILIQTRYLYYVLTLVFSKMFLTSSIEKWVKDYQI